jgi:hypothetical protein
MVPCQPAAQQLARDPQEPRTKLLTATRSVQGACQPSRRGCRRSGFTRQVFGSAIAHLGTEVVQARQGDLMNRR